MYKFNLFSPISTLRLLLLLLSFTEINTSFAVVDIDTGPLTRKDVIKDELEIRLVPLAKDDLKVVTEHWMKQLQNILAGVREPESALAGESRADSKLAEG